MFNTRTELFLETYFTTEAVTSGLGIEPRVVFDKLFSAFLLSAADRDKLFALTERDDVRDIKTYGDYARVRRIEQYAQIVATEFGIDDESRDVISIKGRALQGMEKCGYGDCLGTTSSAICKHVALSAGRGVVLSLNILGIILCEGWYVLEDKDMGLTKLDCSAKWGDIAGIMLALHYDEASRKVNLDRLYSVTFDTVNQDYYETASAKYGIDNAQELPECRMLKKAFASGILSADTYASQYARFIFSPIMNAKDKERALFAGYKTAIAETADLPLKLSYGDIPFDPKALVTRPLIRESECEKVVKGLQNTDMRGMRAYRPICLSCDSEYVLDHYVVAMRKAFGGANVEEIEVADLTQYDLEPSSENVLVRLCDEDKQNVYLLRFRGFIPPAVMATVANFLASEKRSKFRLRHPSAVIDLGAILPICICDKTNERELMDKCDVISLASVSAEEKGEVLDHIIQTKSQKYSASNVCTDVEARSILGGYSIEKAERIIDTVARYHRGEETLQITANMVKEAATIEPATRVRCGFGGV